MKLTPDIQVLRPAQKQEMTINTGGEIPGTSATNIDTVIALGLRLQLVFLCLCQGTAVVIKSNMHS
jgi:hypothetical protein